MRIPRTVLIAIALLLTGIGFAVFMILSKQGTVPPPPEPEPEISTPIIQEYTTTQQTLGHSVEGREIDAYTFGNGSTRILFVGGIHGGYEWNTVLLAEALITHLEQYPELIPQNVSVTVIPNANPDGLVKVTGTEPPFTAVDIQTASVDPATGRFNANTVDLNRNFDCKWQPTSTWRGDTVSAGDAPFSEPEAKVIRDFIYETNPAAVVFWHSQGNAVYGSACENGILPKTVAVMNTYAEASGYRAIELFDAYPITGDAEGWLASIGIPAITVELATHETTDWEQNRKGSEALIQFFGK